MEGGPNRPRTQPARSHKRTFPEASPASWQRTLAGCKTERDLYQAKFLKNVTPLGLHHRHLECHHEVMAPGPGEQFGVPLAFVLFRLVDGLPLPASLPF